MRVSTNIPGLDQILQGGFLQSRTYLVYGQAGTGKTTLGVHFLSSADRGLLITFAEPEESIRADAAAIGMKTDHIAFLDLTPEAGDFAEAQTYDIFSPAEVERETLAQKIAASIEKAAPQRIFVDGFNVFRDLASDPFHYHRVVQAFFRYATSQNSTLLLASDDADATSIVDGIIRLDFTSSGRFV